jgi:toxin ParE1/3/4
VTAPNFSPLVISDLEQILDYIAQDKPGAAEKFVETLREKCETLARFPLIGTPREHLAAGLRAFPVGSLCHLLQAGREHGSHRTRAARRARRR